MQFGLFAPQGWRLSLAGIEDPVEQYETMTAVAKDADAGPWDSVWLFDHFHTYPYATSNATFECWTSTATLARDTQRVKIGQMVTCNAYRQPSLFAKIASTVDVASHGRLLAGYGGGWYEEEWRAYGYDFPETKERMAAFREGVEIIHKMWTEDRPVYEGRHYHIDGPINEPKSHKPGYKIPLWIGGGGEQVTLKLVAKYGDACNLYPAGVPSKLDVLKRHCETVGRDYGEITKSCMVELYPVANGGDVDAARQRMMGHYEEGTHTYLADKTKVLEVDAMVEFLQGLASHGIDYFIVNIPGVAYDRDPMHLLESEVMPAVAAG